MATDPDLAEMAAQIRAMKLMLHDLTIEVKTLAGLNRRLTERTEALHDVIATRIAEVEVIQVGMDDLPPDIRDLFTPKRD